MLQLCEGISVIILIYYGIYYASMPTIKIYAEPVFYIFIRPCRYKYPYLQNKISFNFGPYKKTNNKNIELLTKYQNQVCSTH